MKGGVDDNNFDETFFYHQLNWKCIFVLVRIVCPKVEHSVLAEAQFTAMLFLYSRLAPIKEISLQYLSLRPCATSFL